MFPTERVTTNVGVYLATVTKVEGTTAYVEVPLLARGYEYGPAHYPDHLATDGTTGPAGAHGHTAQAAGTHGHDYNGSHTHEAWSSSTGTVLVGDAGAHEHGQAGAHAHSIDTTPDHRHAMSRPLEQGDRVAVAFVNGGRDDLVILFRLA